MASVVSVNDDIAAKPIASPLHTGSLAECQSRSLTFPDLWCSRLADRFRESQSATHWVDEPNVLGSLGWRRLHVKTHGIWYYIWLPKYGESHGRPVQAALQEIIDLYFSEGRPKG